MSYGMKIGIFYKQNKVQDEAIIATIVNELNRRGSEAVIFRDSTEINGVDRVLVLGGDGTVLHAAKSVSSNNVPVVGINFGTVGFLTEFERDELCGAIDLILDESCDTIESSMLEIKLNGKISHCLNEMILQRDTSSHANSQIAKISVLIDGSRAGEFNADGLIVATPTGSTAYSLSAGGSIMCPTCNTFILTPICAFSLKSRPIVYPDSSTISFDFTKSKSMLLYGDGKYLGEVHEGDCLTVKKSERRVIFLTKDRNDFFRRLAEKIG